MKHALIRMGKVRNNQFQIAESMRFWAIFLILALGAIPAWAQPSKMLPSVPADFISAFVSQTNKFGEKDLAQYLNGFEERWKAGTYTAEEQESFISQVNVMLLKNYLLNPEVLEYAKAFEAIKSPTSFGKLEPSEFFKVTDACIQDMQRPEVVKFYKFVQQFSTTGAAFKTSNASWSFSTPNPKLGFRAYESKELNKTFYFPYLSFVTTDLIYRNSSDSTKIYGTSGDLNIMNLMFNAKGGKIDWSKMKLDPNDVYAEVGKYGLNLNYSFVKIDSVTFHYNSLIKQTLVGKYEDINKGYRDINKANYPYFRSYDGGVVIENFIPNVRYEGGFSLRGVRKIGSAYTKLVDIEKKDEEIVAPKKTKQEEEAEKEAEELAEELGFDYDENAYLIDDGEDFVEDTWGEEDPEPESEDETSGGDFDDVDAFDMPQLDKELKVVKAQLTIFRNQKPAMNLRALEFVLDLDKLVSKRAEVALYINEKDSITHPSVGVIYEVDSSEITLIKDVKDKFARQAFLSPYHNYYLYFDAIRWRTTTDIIQFTAIIDRENQTSAIESKDFYNLQRWRQFKGVLSFHPVGAIYRYITQNPGAPVTPEAIVAENGRMEELESFKMHLVDVEGSGFLNWNRETGEITPLPKLNDWARAARGKDDYDAIQVISQVKTGNNAELDLRDLDMDLYGVPFFSLSDSQFVRVKPSQRHVVVKASRDMQFDGIAAAGKLDFYGRVGADTAAYSTLPGKFKFQYENFKILLDSIDSLRFSPGRFLGVGASMSKLQKALSATTIEGVTGAIYINKPNNKNGLERLAEYPVFDSYTNSYIYWARQGIRDGVYTKDKMFFSIDPFVLDSLEDFNESAIFFEGELFTSEIFPRMRQRLVVMPDYTLGLVQTTPLDTGYSAYGKGRFKGDIKLDGTGLSSDGEMTFLHTVADADSFQMFFDSVRAVTNKFFMPGGEHEGAYYPEVKANAVGYKWLTKKDEIELQTMNKGEPIVMFGGEGYFEGKLTITKQGLVGNGKLTMGNVEVVSKEIVFKEKDFTAKKGMFTVRDRNNPGKVLYNAKDVAIDYDVNKHHSTFTSGTMGVANSSFPQQKYACSLSKGTYDKVENDLVLEQVSPKEKDNFFVSTDPLQDSLRYNASKAHYNFDAQQIEVEGVKQIFVADAVITPDTGKVTVKPDGFLAQLKEATVVANVAHQHRVYDANVEIMSSKRYNGSGKYDYIPVMGKDQFINMTEIKVQGDSMTIAKGDIKEEQKFYLTERIIFKGNTELIANQRFMNFRGEVKIDSKNAFFADKWFVYNVDNVNPDSIFVPIAKETLGKLVVGLHYIKRNRLFYSTFLGNRKNTDDIDVALAEGGLTFDRGENSFRIGPKAKLTGQDYRGTTSTFSDETGVITTAGLLNLPYNFGKNMIGMGIAGKWRDDPSTREVVTDVVGTFQFDIIPKEAWAKLAEKARIVTATNKPIDWTSYALREGLSEFLDPKGGKPENTNAFIAEVNKMVVPGEIKAAKKLPYSLVLGNIPFRFDPYTKSLWAGGDMGIIGINSEPINMMSSTNSKIEYNIGKYTAAGLALPDTLRLYLEFDENNWVYFEFRENVLYTASSDLDGYNAVLRAEIEKRKKSEGYRFELLDESARDVFFNRVLERYYSEKERPPLEDELGNGGTPPPGDGGTPPPGDGGTPPPGDGGTPPPGDGGTPPPGDDKKDDGEGGPLDDGLDDGGK